MLVGYFNRNTKQEFDIPAGPNNRIEPGGPDQGQPTHFNAGRQWGVFTIKLPKDFGTKKLTLDDRRQRLHQHDHAPHATPTTSSSRSRTPANKNTPPKLKFEPNGPIFTGPPNDDRREVHRHRRRAAAAAPCGCPTKVRRSTCPSRAAGAGRGARGADAAAGAAGATGATGAAGGRGAARGAAPEGFTPPPPMALTWTKFRGPGDVKFDNNKPSIDRAADGKAVTNATFSAPGDYILRVEGNDSTGSGGGGFQCCWSNAHVGVTRRSSRRRRSSQRRGGSIVPRSRNRIGRENTQIRRIVAGDAGDDPRGRADSARRAPARAGHRRRLGVSGRHQPAARVRAAGRARRRVVRGRVRADRPPASVRRRRSWSAARPAPRARAQVDALLAELRSTLQGIHLLRHCPLRALDMTASFGERLSAFIVAASSRRAPHARVFVDARDFLVTDDQFTHANVSFPATNRRTRAYFSRLFQRVAARRCRSSPASSAPPPTARRRRSGATDRTTAPRSSAPRSARR